jgi:hypothetical protein
MVRQTARTQLAFSLRELLTQLAGIEETVPLYTGDWGRPQVHHILTNMDSIQRRLYAIFELGIYSPTR